LSPERQRSGKLTNRILIHRQVTEYRNLNLIQERREDERGGEQSELLV
jgi:hypothetical protein